MARALAAAEEHSAFADIGIVALVLVGRRAVPAGGWSAVTGEGAVLIGERPVLADGGVAWSAGCAIRGESGGAVVCGGALKLSVCGCGAGGTLAANG